MRPTSVRLFQSSFCSIEFKHLLAVYTLIQFILTFFASLFYFYWGGSFFEYVDGCKERH